MSDKVKSGFAQIHAEMAKSYVMPLDAAANIIDAKDAELSELRWQAVQDSVNNNHAARREFIDALSAKDAEIDAANEIIKGLYKEIEELQGFICPSVTTF